MSNTNTETLNPISREAQPSTDLLDYEVAFKDLVERDPELSALIKKAQHLQAEGKIGEMEGYIDSGSDKDVIAYKGMALKLKHKESVSGRTIAQQVEPLLEAKGVANFEQLIAVDNESGVVLTSLHQGTPLSYLPVKDLLKVKPQHLAELHTALEEMRARGLHPHNTGGVLFDKKAGFSFVDYEKSDAYGNSGDISSTELYLKFLLQDHEKIDELERLRRLPGLSFPDSAYKTTGTRALAQTIILRRWKKAKKEATRQ